MFVFILLIIAFVFLTNAIEALILN